MATLRSSSSALRLRPHPPLPPKKRSSSKVLDLSPESPQGFANAKSRLAWSVLSHSLCSGQLVPVAPPGPSPSPRSQTHSFGTRGFTERSAACCGRVGKWQRSSLSLLWFLVVVGPPLCSCTFPLLLPFKLFLSLFSPHFSRHPFVARLSTTRAGFPTIAPRDLFPPTAYSSTFVLEALLPRSPPPLCSRRESLP